MTVETSGLGRVTQEEALETVPLTQIYDHIDRHAAEYVEEVRRFLRIPGFSDTGEGISVTAAACLDYLKMLGAEDAQLVETGGAPVVYGKLRSKRPNAKTLFIYSLYDTVPIGPPGDWTFPSHGAHVVDAAAIGLPSELGSVICNRGAHNHRGPMLSALLGIKVMLDYLDDLPVNVVFCWDGEEEIGSPHLDVFLEKFQNEVRRCEGMWGPSMRQGPSGTMVVPLHYKGGLVLALECKGGSWGGTVDGRHTHAEHAPEIDCPLLMLVRAVASMFGEANEITIDGLDALLPPMTEEDRAELEGMRSSMLADEDAGESYSKAVIGIEKFRGGHRLADLIEPLLFTGVQGSLQAFHGGHTGPLNFNITPQAAIAKMSMYLPHGGPSPDDVLDLLRAHLDRRGLEHVEIRKLWGVLSSTTPKDSPLVLAGIRAAAVHGAETRLVPRINGANTAAERVNRYGDGVPQVWVGLGCADRPHQADEFCTVRGIPAMMKFAVTYLHEWAKEPSTKFVREADSANGS